MNASYRNEQDGLVLIVRREGCLHCDAALDLLVLCGITPHIVYSDDIKDLFKEVHNTVPQVYYRGTKKADAAKLRLWFTMGKAERVKKGLFQ